MVDVPGLKWKIRHVLGPVAAAVFPVISLYSANLDWIIFPQLALPLSVLLVLALVLFSLFRVVYRSGDKACFVAICFLALMWSYGAVVPVQVTHEPGATPESWMRVLLYQGLVLGFGILAIVVYRSGKPWAVAARLASLFAVSFLCVAVLQIGWQRARNVLAARSARLPAVEKAAGGFSVGFAPDVYHIILDGYSREDVLARLYDLDNKPFLDALKSRGFRILPASRSNYMQTLLSLTSMLNMTYLDQLPGPGGSAYLYREHLARLIRDSAVIAEFRKRGYTQVRLLSDMEFLNGTGGLEIRPPRVMFDLTRVDLYDTLIRSTPFRVLPLDSWFAAPSQPLVLFQFQTLRRPMPGDTGPLFVFAHVMCPHPPFVFDRNGNRPPGPLQKSVADGSDFPGTAEEYRHGYAEQVRFVNQQVIAAVDSILGRYSPEQRPIIIIQGDHGGGSGYHEEELEKTLAWERAGILNAFLLPAKGRFDLYDTMTPVNSYRMILNGLFGAHYERLPDRTYYAPFSRPYDQTLIPEEKLAIPAKVGRRDTETQR